MDDDLFVTETFNFCVNGRVVMSIDADGMTYKGKRIEDAGEAYQAFLAVTRDMVIAQKRK